MLMRSLLMLLQNVADGGGGAGVGAGSTGTGGAGAGSGSAGAGNAAGAGAGSGAGGAAPSVYDLSPDAMIRIPGQTDPVKFSEYNKGFIPREQVGSLVREIIAASRQQAQPQTQPQQTPPDPFASIEQMQTVDGKTAAMLMRQIVKDGFGPRDQVIKALRDEVRALTGHVSTERSGSLQNDYAISRESVIKALPLPKLNHPIEGATDALNEFVDGVFWKYDFDKRFTNPQQRAHAVQEFTDTVKKEFDVQRKFFRALEKADLEAAQDRQKQQRFVRPTGQTGPNGRPQTIRETNMQKAKRLRGGFESST